MASGAPHATVQVGIDETRKRILVWIIGPATGPLVSSRISELFRRRPELAAYDMLYDLSEYTGDVTSDEIDPIVEAYAACRADLALPCRTAFLTYDRHFQHWATAMDEQFVGREHRAFPRIGPALAFLDTPLPERPRRFA